MRVSQVILSGERTINAILEALNNRLTFGDNFQAKQVVIPDSGTADTTITVFHNLGKIPVGYIANLDQAGIVYDDSRITWTDSEMTVKCSVSNASIVLVIF